jgi:hypothetical protein
MVRIQDMAQGSRIWLQLRHMHDPWSIRSWTVVRGIPMLGSGGNDEETDHPIEMGTRG